MNPVEGTTEWCIPVMCIRGCAVRSLVRTVQTHAPTRTFSLGSLGDDTEVFAIGNVQVMLAHVGLLEPLARVVGYVPPRVVCRWSQDLGPVRMAQRAVRAVFLRSRGPEGRFPLSDVHDYGHPHDRIAAVKSWRRSTRHYGLPVPSRSQILG